MISFGTETNWVVLMCYKYVHRIVWCSKAVQSFLRMGFGITTGINQASQASCCLTPTYTQNVSAVRTVAMHASSWPWSCDIRTHDFIFIRGRAQFPGSFIQRIVRLNSRSIAITGTHIATLRQADVSKVISLSQISYTSFPSVVTDLLKNQTLQGSKWPGPRGRGDHKEVWITGVEMVRGRSDLYHRLSVRRAYMSLCEDILF